MTSVIETTEQIWIAFDVNERLENFLVASDRCFCHLDTNKYFIWKRNNFQLFLMVLWATERYISDSVKV